MSVFILFAVNNARFSHSRATNDTVQLSTDQVLLENGCHDSLTYLRGQNLESGTKLKNICGGQALSQTIVTSPGQEPVHVLFKSDISITDRGFNVTYKHHSCGGILNGPSSRIESRTNGADCVWLLNYEEGQQILLSRFSVNMERSDNIQCGQRGASYVVIRNGGK